MKTPAFGLAFFCGWQCISSLRDPGLGPRWGYLFFGKRTRCAQTPFSGRKGIPTPCPAWPRGYFYLL